MTPSPDQILAAARNTRLPAMTRGSRLYAALQHVRQSQKEKASAAADLSLCAVAARPAMKETHRGRVK